MVFLGSSLSASSLTLLVDTRDELPAEEMENSRSVKVVSIETGIMDTLFDEGHIFFNMYSSRIEGAEEAADANALKYAEELGAGFLLVLLPEEEGASWRFYRVGSASIEGRGYSDFHDTDPEKEIRERWISLGVSLAFEVVHLIL